MDFDKLRRDMVERQLMARGISDERVLDVMGRIPRHLFVDESIRHRAYDDCALPIGEGQTISQPYMVAVMTELLIPREGSRVLEIGTGSGYQAAVLAELGCEVFSVERSPVLNERASRVLEKLGYPNVHLFVGDGSKGLPEHAPFDRIIITAASPDIPQPLIDQLSDGGILVAPIGGRFSQQLHRIVKHGRDLERGLFTPCVFVPLIGEYGWKEE
ncbi:MAG: protein-L-isoaspartate(D-aspartate) O-methyltransferase [Nitrospirae bacterium]|nr:MAG: protein-L-isoaspartate(D-aspartate) O-methyltransferase [Nitrospirota bacterium]